MNWDEVKVQMVSLLLNEVKDLWKRPDPEFIEKLVEDTIEQKRLASEELKKHATRRAEVHLHNIRHLAATLDAEVARRHIRFAFRCRGIFIKVLTVGLRTMAMEALS